MATVFLAEDERLGRPVAVKRLHGESTEEVARRFRREARLGAALNHPNVVAVYDIASDDEGVLIVMEYVEGRTLKEELSEGRLQPERAIAILRGIAGALDYAHENGVVHRDVKPANILIRRDGTVKLADLGIATAAEQSKITRSGSVLGTAAYMPPERLDGRPGGAAADVYALSAVAFEMLSGRKAYEGNTPLEVAHRVVNDPTPDLRRSWRDAPEPLAEALKRGLAWEPDKRFASAGELVAAIEAALPEAAAGAEVEPAAGAAAAAVAPIAGEAAAAAPHVREEPEHEPADASDGSATPARVLPPERARTRPARAAEFAPAGAIPHAAAAGSEGADSDPPAGRQAPAGPRRRPELPLIAAVLGVLALLAIVLITTGNSHSGKSTGKSSSAGIASGSRKKANGSASRKPKGSTPTAPRRTTPATPAAPDAPSGSDSAGAPEASVNGFYTRAAGGDYAGAWNLATPNGQQELGGFESFRRGQSTLRSISFPELRSIRQSGDAATVKLRSQAVHTDRTDRCQGTIDLVKSGGAWKLDRFHITGCAKSPRP
jgi:serine/threonine-protein kinase